MKLELESVTPANTLMRWYARVEPVLSNLAYAAA